MLTNETQNILRAKNQAAGLTGGAFELELRYRGISKYEYDRVIAFAKQRFATKTLVLTDYFVGKDRYTSDGSTITKTTKTDVYHRDFPRDALQPKDIRLSLAYELDQPANIDDTDNPTFIRKKTRHVFSSHSVRLEVTTVETFSPNKVLYEIEIEADTVNNETIQYMQSMHHQVTNVILQVHAITSFNLYTHGNIREKTLAMNFRALARVRNLKTDDITYDGLCNGDYCITTKADGERVVLLIDQTGIWSLQDRKGSDIVERITDTPISLKSFGGILLDCEKIFTHNEETLYIPFDILAVKGSSTVSSRPLLGERSRYSYVQHIAKQLCPVMNIELKGYVRINTTSESLTEAVKETLDFAQSRDYDNDGFIITPISVAYNPNTSSIRLDKRILKDYPDVCKLKPWDLLTIDMIIKDSKAYVTSDVGSKLIPFEPKRFPFNPLTQLVNIDDVDPNIVMELAPERTIVDGRTYIVLKPYRTRPDKSTPNRVKIAESVWTDLHDPITTDTLQGRDLKLIKLYHNYVKRHILSQVPRHSNMVDIGSGKMGDMKKWSHINKILAVEPCTEYIEEAYRRLNNYSRQIDVTIVQAGGEDTDIIMKEFNRINMTGQSDTGSPRKPRPLSIVSMLSMSFLWSSSEIFDGFVKTLRSIASAHGEPVWFHFMTIDGHAVQELFDNKSGTRHLDTATIKYDHIKEKVHIHIKDSIVTDQTEYLVKIEDLVAAVTPSGASPEYSLIRADSIVPESPEYVFSETNKEFNGLYAYGKVKVWGLGV